MAEAVTEPIFELHGGRYAVFEPLGEGGTATVHRCLDRELGVERAIKLRRVRPSERDAAMVRRLEDEARVMARLRHPHVLPVYDVGWDRGWQYVVMALAPRGALQDRIDVDGPLAPREAVDLVLPVLDALGTAHAAGIVHRDLKPHNILLGADGTPMLADWGIARLDDREHTLTKTGAAMGSLAFMAPEQRLDAHEVGPAADVYAVAATLYHLVTGATPVDLFHAAPASPRWEDVPDALVPVLQQASAHEPSARPSLADLRARLEALRATLPEVAAVPPPLEDEGGTREVERPAPPTRRRGAWLAGGLALAGLVVALGAVGVSTLGPRPPADRPRGASPPDVDVDAATAVLEPVPASLPEAVLPPVTAGDAGDAADVRPEDPPASPAPSPEPAPGTATAEPLSGIPPVTPSRAAPPLPVHGAWSGSLEGSVTRLTLGGPAVALTGEVVVRGVDGVSSAAARGRYDADEDVVVLDVAGPGSAAGEWTLRVAGDRMRGTLTRRGTAEVTSVSLIRSKSR